MTVLPALIIGIPAVAAILSFVLPSRVGRIVTAIGGLATAAAILAYAFDVAQGAGDALTALFLLPVAIVYGTVGLYTQWYAQAEFDAPSDERQRRAFLSLTNAFACAEAVIPLLTNLAGVWVALEITTIVAALLVRIQGTDGALEAAWKYILIASCGLAIGLVGVIVLYASGTGALGMRYEPQWGVFIGAAAKLQPDAVRIAFILALIGFGTKMGLAPMHTWLPDAHGAGPTPTSAMLSGILLSDALYVILRFTSIANAALGTGLTDRMFFIVGLLSLFLGAFFLLRQRDVKRMLAYSSIEHMGIIACGLAFGAPLAVTGALLHAINHSATKSLAFLLCRPADAPFRHARDRRDARRNRRDAGLRNVVHARGPGSRGNAPVRHVSQRADDSGRRLRIEDVVDRGRRARADARCSRRYRALGHRHQRR